MSKFIGENFVLIRLEELLMILCAMPSMETM
jgi:hypothetical protein